jgi:hypothetical protein
MNAAFKGKVLEPIISLITKNYPAPAAVDLLKSDRS